MKGTWIREPRAELAIIFVHGILSDGDACWRHPNGTYWPELIAAEPSLESAGVYVFTYKTGLNSGSYRLGDVVDALKEQLRLDGVTGCRQWLFVAHSMGGIVVRRLIVSRATALTQEQKQIGLFLVASPSLGSNYGSLVAPLARAFNHAQADVLRFSQDNAWLNDLDKDFINLKSANQFSMQGKELVEDCFYVFKTVFAKKQVVPPFTGARYFGDPFKVPDSNHSTIAKPDSAQSIQHRLLVQFVRDVVAVEAPRTESASPNPEPTSGGGPASAFLQDNERGEPGLSHRLDSIHLHVDGAQAKDLIHDFAAEQRRHGRTTEIASIERALAGPQRQDLPGTYRLHTPGSTAVEELDYFSTTSLYSGPTCPDRSARQSIASVVNDLLGEFDARVDDTSGIVVELERVVGTVDSVGTVALSGELALRNDVKEDLLADLFFSPFDGASGKPGARAAAYEYHFSIDIARPDLHHPIPLERMMAISQQAGLRIGGWFMFRDPERWAYRSNSFESEVSHRLLKDRWQRLRDKLSSDSIPALRNARLRLLAEEALAVWKTPVSLGQVDVLTLHRLAAWERNLPDLGEFWVILPNFLGDRNLRIAAAMLNNFKRDTRYVYFLRTHADAKRWLAFKDRMVERDPAAESLMSAYVVGFADLGEWKNVAAFIANPRATMPEGVRLQVDPVSNEVRYGRTMPASRVRLIVEGLTPVMAGGSISSWQRVEGGQPASMVVAVCLNLMIDPGEEMFEVLDGELAVAASSLNGEIALYGTKSITAIFEGSRVGLEHALKFAMDVLRRTEALGLGTKVPRAGIDFGEARQTPRACGMLWTGPAMRGSRGVLFGALELPGVYVSHSVGDLWQASGASAINALSEGGISVQVTAMA